MTSVPPRILAAALVLLVCRLAPGAGPPPMGALPPDEAVEAGPWQIRPSLVVSYGYDDNILFRSEEQSEAVEQARQDCLDDPAAPRPCPRLRPLFKDRYVEVRPTLGMRLPFSQSYTEVTYRPSVLRYQAFDLEEEVSHGVDADLNLSMGTGDTLRMQGRYDRGLIEIETLDQAGETSFDAQQYRSVESRAVYRRNPGGVRGIEASVSYVDFTFDNVEGRAFSDFETLRAGLTYAVEQGPETTWSGVLELADVDRAFVGGTSQAAGLETWGAGVGVSRRLRGSARLTGRLLLTRLKGALFEQGPSASGDPVVVDGSSFTGVALNLGYATQSEEGAGLDVRLRHRPVQSFFFNSEYFLSTGLTAAWQQPLGGRCVLALEGRLIYNDYPTPLDSTADRAGSAFEDLGVVGVAREDVISGASAVVEWPVRRRVRWAVGGAVTYRSSNLPLLDYDQARIFTQITLGWD